jgi:hypothetical protein
MKSKDQILLESLYNKIIQEQMDEMGDEQMESEYELRTDIGDEEPSIEDIEAKLNKEDEEGEEEKTEEESPLEQEAEEELPADAPEEGLTDDEADLFSQLIKQES